MYLFTRQIRLAPGHLREAAEWAVGVTEKVNQITSLNVGLWSKVLSPGLGTMSWGAAVESLGDLDDGNAKLMADDVFVELVNRGAAFTTGGADDQTAQFLHNPADPSFNTQCVAVVQSQLANGSFQKGVEVGIEIAMKATEIGGLPTAFLLSSTGMYGGCAWITSGTSLRELERAEQAVNANADFVAFIDKKAKDCYIEGITTQALWQRIV